MAQFAFQTTGEEACSALSSHIKGRTVIVTGVTPGGLGLETARSIALQHPKWLIIAGRAPATVQKAEDIIKQSAPDTPVRQLILDLGSLQAVREAAAEVNGWVDVPSIDVVINNAGIMARPYELTKDGIESQFGTNHIAHFLFTQLIMKKVLAAGPGARIVNLSSNGYRGGGVRFDDWNFENGKSYDRWKSYAQSKSANILYSKALAQRYKDKGIQSYSVHPGAIWTNLGHHAKDDLKAMGVMDENGNLIDSARTTWKTLGQGVSTSIVAAFDPSIADQSGAYLSNCQIEETPEAFIQDPEGPEKLWKLSERLVGENFDV